MSYYLPTSVTVGGTEYAIRSDYRAALDIFAVLSDPELDDADKTEAIINIFYLSPEDMPEADYQEAVDQCMKFLSDDTDSMGKNNPVLVDWEKDFKYIAAPVNRVLGYECRAVPWDSGTNTGGVHWHTFLAAYLEIGECFFSQVVGIRAKKARGKTLDKSEREFYKHNQDIVDIKVNYTEAENTLIDQWTGQIKQ